MLINGREVKKQVVQRPFMNNFKRPIQQPAQKPQPKAGSINNFNTPKPSFLELKNRIISFIRQNGPVIPIQVAKAFGKDTMFAGAMLSELIANRVLRVTSAKIGGSPVYYMPEQQSKLEILREHLGKAPKQAYDLLKEKKIIRDNECESWERVALRELKDFAFPIAVRHDDGNEEIFWRWHLLPEDDARKKITSIVSGNVEEIPVEPEALAVAGPIEPKPEPIEPKPEPIKPKPEPIKPEKPDIEDPRKKEQLKLKPKKPKKEKVDAFRNELLELFRQKGLEVLEEVPMKKNEYGFVVKLDSSLGKISCLAIAKNKKKLSDDDVLLSYSVAQHHKLPLVLAGKELTKKASALLEKDARGVVFLAL